MARKQLTLQQWLDKGAVPSDTVVKLKKRYAQSLKKSSETVAPQAKVKKTAPKKAEEAPVEIGRAHV